MSLAQIEYFVAIAEEGHMGRAASRLHVSQPPLSRQLKNLEEELGARLFSRTPRGMALLPAGRRFLEHARRVLAEVEAARRALREPQPELGPEPEPYRTPAESRTSPKSAPSGPPRMASIAAITSS